MCLEGELLLQILPEADIYRFEDFSVKSIHGRIANWSTYIHPVKASCKQYLKRDKSWSAIYMLYTTQANIRDFSSFFDCVLLC